MGVSLIVYQFKQEIYKDLVVQLKKLRDNYHDDNIVYETLRERDRLIEKGEISYFYYHSICVNDITVILTQDDYGNYDTTKIGYTALYGKVENELTHPDAHISYLQTEDIRKIVAFFEKLNIHTREGFFHYYSNLPPKVKDDLLGDWQGQTPEEYYYKDIKEVYDFYKDCVKNGSWVQFELG